MTCSWSLPYFIHMLSPVIMSKPSYLFLPLLPRIGEFPIKQKQDPGRPSALQSFFTIWSHEWIAVFWEFMVTNKFSFVFFLFLGYYKYFHKSVTNPTITSLYAWMLKSTCQQQSNRVTKFAAYSELIMLHHDIRHSYFRLTSLLLQSCILFHLCAVLDTVSINILSLNTDFT